MLMLVPSLLMLPFQTPGSASFAVTALCAVIGGLFGLVLLATSRLPRPAPPPPDRRVAKPVQTSSNGAGRREATRDDGPAEIGRDQR